jgi:DNA mismatch endonuclease, patch repair protein
MVDMVKPMRTEKGTSWASSPGVRRSMQANKSKDTTVEVRLRSALHKSGLRFRKNVRPVQGLRCSADLVFLRQRVAVFVDGCFWHSCPLHATRPKTNREWWELKLRATVERDASNRRALEQAGWVVVQVWEHEPLEQAVSVIRLALQIAFEIPCGSLPDDG